MDYRLVRSKRKTLGIEVNRELEVIVRVPLFVSKRRIEKFVCEHEKWVEKAKLKVAEAVKNRPPEPTAPEIQALKQKAREIIPDRVLYYSNLTGLTPTAVKITSAKKRYGSCSGKNSLCFSYLLMRCPQNAIDYVVLHEIAHIKHKNHGRQFYSFIEKYMPDYKEREKLLKTRA